MLTSKKYNKHLTPMSSLFSRLIYCFGILLFTCCTFLMYHYVSLCKETTSLSLSTKLSSKSLLNASKVFSSPSVSSVSLHFDATNSGSGNHVTFKSIEQQFLKRYDDIVWFYQGSILKEKIDYLRKKDGDLMGTLLHQLKQLEQHTITLEKMKTPSQSKDSSEKKRKDIIKTIKELENELHTLWDRLTVVTYEIESSLRQWNTEHPSEEALLLVMKVYVQKLTNTIHKNMQSTNSKGERITDRKNYNKILKFLQLHEFIK